MGPLRSARALHMHADIDRGSKPRVVIVDSVGLQAWQDKVRVAPVQQPVPHRWAACVILLWNAPQAWEPGVGKALQSRVAHELRSLADDSNATVLVTHPGSLRGVVRVLGCGPTL